MLSDKNIKSAVLNLENTSTSATKSATYRPDIDGIRAIAVLAVVAFHAFPQILPGGFVGVDVFFIISGFLISSIILQGLQHGNFSFAHFYARRIQRIFPALIVVMAACGVFGWFALFPDELKMLGKHMFAGSAFVSNFFFWNEVGYFDTAAETKPLLHLWSLGIEEQFYIVWPILLVFAYRRKANLALVLLAFAGLSFLLNIGGLRPYPTATFYSPISRAWELLLGAALAYVTLQSGAARGSLGAQQEPLVQGGSSLRSLVSWFALALIVVTALALGRKDPFPGAAALLPTIGALLLIGAGPTAWVNRRLLASRPLVWIGLISYPLYLWHWPLLSFAQIVESGQPSPSIRGAALAAALVLAALTYYLLEMPLRRYARSRIKVTALALFMLVLAAAGAALFQFNGFAGRASVQESAEQQKALILVEDVANAQACKKRYGFDSLYAYCQLAKVGQDPTVALVGDSHAYHVMAGLSRHYTAQGENFLLLGTRLPFFGIVARENDDYQKATPQMMELALNTPSIKTVLLATAQKFDIADPVLLDALRLTLQKFTAVGKRVVVIDDVPTLDFDPRSCIKRAAIASSKTRTDCSINRAEFERSTQGHRAALQTVLKDFPQVELFATAPHLCDDKRCYAKLGGKLMYRDTNHLTYGGDLFMGEKFAQQQAARKAGAPKP